MAAAADRRRRRRRKARQKEIGTDGEISEGGGRTEAETGRPSTILRADTINPSKKLGDNLEFLIGEFDREDVVRRFTKEILAARDASVKYKTELDPLIASMVDQAEVFVTMELVANRGVSALTKLVDINLVPLSNGIHTLALAQGGLDLALKEVNASVEEQVEGFAEANERMAEVAAVSWIDSYREILSPDAIGQTLARAFEGAGGFLGALKSLASRVAGMFMNHMGGLFSTGLKTILPSVFGAVTKAVIPTATAALTTAGTVRRRRELRRL